MVQIYRIPYFFAVEFLLLALTVKIFPSPTSTGMALLGTSITYVAWGISKKLAQ